MSSRPQHETLSRDRQSRLRPTGLGRNGKAAALSPQAFEGYIVEYEQCIESYRHAVSTIWKASAVVSVISAGVFAFAFSANSGASSSISSFAQALALLPMIVWCFGIYRPLNRYAELKCDRVCRIEKLLEERVPDLQMRHFRDYRDHRREEAVADRPGTTRRDIWRREWRRLWTLRMITEPRIVEVVTGCGLGLVALEVVVVAHGLTG